MRFRRHVRLLALGGWIWSVAAATPALGVVSPAERAALVALYNATNGSGWLTNTNWLGAPGTECTWHGVQCDALQYTVVELQLAGNHLSGQLPPEIAGLAGLRFLSLHTNAIGGDLPTTLGLMQSLEVIGLDHNRLGGSIPASLGGLSGLKTLRLEANRLGGPIPLSLMGLGSLLPGELDLRYNGLTASDPALRTFLNSKQAGGDFESTQTIIPQNLGVSSVTSSSVTLSWSLIPYQADAGRYVVSSATALAGPYTDVVSTATKSVGTATVSGLSPATTYYFRVRTVTDANANNANAVETPPSEIVSGATAGPGGGACPTPGAPILAAPASVPAARPFLVGWTAPSGVLATGVVYVLEISTDAAFPAALRQLYTSTDRSFLVKPDRSLAGPMLHLRVRATQTCGATTNLGAYSPTVAVSVIQPPAEFKVTRAATSFIATAGQPVPPGSVTYVNVGGSPGTLTLAPTGSFFDVTPGFVTLAPGAQATVSLTVRPEALTAPGFSSGLLLASDGGPGAPIATVVSLSVAPSGTAPGSNAGAKLRLSAPTVIFKGGSGQTPAPQTVDVSVVGAPNAGPFYLVVAVGPGGSWLSLSPDVASPIPPNGSLPITLSVDRSRRSPDEPAGPRRALVRFAVAGGTPGDTAILEVLDVEPPPIQGAAGARSNAPPPGGTSFIVPTTVRGTSASGAVLKTDGWLRNEGTTALPAELFLTPDGKNGLTDASLVKASLTLPAGSTYRLSDLLASVFQSTGSGQVELRTATPKQLSLRTTVESLVGDDATSRYGTEIPVVPYGDGAAASQGEWTLPAVSENAANRTNLVLAETTGAEATVRVVVRDAAGALVGQPIDRTIPPFGKTQINGLTAATTAGVTLTGGSASVTVTGGTGKVVALSTVIDNRSGSFSAVRARPSRFSTSAPTGSKEGATLAGAAGATTTDAPFTPAADALTLILPSIARLTGANNTQFTTSVSITNLVGSAAALSLTYNYVDVADGGARKTATVPVSVPARGSLPDSQGADAIAALFGLTGPTYGWISVAGDVAKVVAVASVSSLVDPLDPSKGLKTSQVDGLFSDSPDLIVVSGGDHRFAGVEKSEQKRTNLILVETSNQPCAAVVRAYDAVGAPLAEKSYDLAANQYLQINDVLGDTGLGLGEGPFQDVAVSSEISTGTCKLVGLATVIDNQSKNPQIFVLKAVGPPAPGGGTIGF